jgi:putative flippase GtrA
MDAKLKNKLKEQIGFSNTLLTLKKNTFIYKTYYWLISYPIFYKIRFFLKYSLVGILGSFIGLLVLYILSSVGLYYIISVFISDFVGNYINYNLHKKYAFKKTSKNIYYNIISFLKYYFVSIISILMVFVFVIFFVEIFKFEPIVAKICSDLIILFVRFTGHKLTFER